MDINLKLHTMILLVGPSGCGKSYFSTNLKDQLDAQLLEAGITPNVQILSSDDLRREVLGDSSLHKHDPKMMHASRSAFELLHTKIDYLTKHPTLAHFVIVDTTGLSKRFRDRILEQSKQNNYGTACVIFDYKKNDEYFKYNDEDPQFKGWVTRAHIERMRKKFWKEFDRKRYKKVIKVKSKDNISDVEVNIDNLSDYSKCLLSDSETIYDIVGDVHGCYDEFINLLFNLGYKINTDDIITGHALDENRKIISVGDLIDKGPDSKKVLKFVLQNPDYFILVRGNHENFVAKWHKGLLKNLDMEDEFRQRVFDTTFTEDEEFIKLIKKYDEISIPFVKSDTFIVTHGPAEQKYMEKLDSKSVRNQLKGKDGRELLLADNNTQDANAEHYSYLREEAERSFPYHVFGHLAFKNVLKEGNKLGIDTGCVHGGKLTAVTIIGDKLQFNYQDSLTVKEEWKQELFDLFKKESDKYDFNLEHLEPREIGRIKWACEEKVNFISGTMSPSEADLENGDIEPLHKAFEYYKNAGIEEVVVQPKYMGSRCNLYLHRLDDKSYATSRKGFVIKHVDLSEAIKKINTDELWNKHPEAEWLVLDAELMPWHALGEGLIENTFKVVEAGIESELEMLKQTGFEEELKKLEQSENFKQYKYEEVKSSKKDLVKKYGHHNVQTYRALLNYTHYPLSMHEQGLSVYKRQLEVFGSPGEVRFNPFAYLKIINKDGTEVIPDDNLNMFRMLNSDTCVHVELDDPGDIADAEAFFEQLTENLEMEGVVIKPRYHTDEVAPFMKVRSKNYLTIVYGYDYQFPHKYQRLVQSKRVRSKLRTSIKEYQIGRKMLETPRGEITNENIEYHKLIANMIAEEKREEKFDPRL